MRILFQNFKKVLKGPKKKIFLKKIRRVPKDAEFYAESKSVEKVEKSQTKKKL
jgi:hypothetical protein